MSANVLLKLLKAGMESNEDAVDGVVVVPATPEDGVIPKLENEVPVEEIEVVNAAADAVNAEAALVAANNLATADSDAVKAQADVVTDTAVVQASMEAFIGSPMSKEAAFILQNEVAIAVRGQWDHTKATGSLEAFGTDIGTDEALNAGLEGLGEFLVNAAQKLRDGMRKMRASFATVFKEMGVNEQKVSARAEAIIRLAKNTTGESNAVTIQLPLDTAWRLAREGKLQDNLPKELAGLSKLTELVLKKSPDELLKHRAEFVKSLGDITGTDWDGAIEIAKKMVQFKLPEPVYAKNKTANTSRVITVTCSEEFLGEKALFVTAPNTDIDKSLPLDQQLTRASDRLMETDIEIKPVSKKSGSLNVNISTLKPAEIIKLAGDIASLMTDIRSYATSYAIWGSENNELDRAIAVLENVPWTQDTGGSIDASTSGGVVYISQTPLNVRMADLLWMIDMVYMVSAVDPVRVFSTEVIQVCNRMLEVCERSLATYSDNNLK